MEWKEQTSQDVHAIPGAAAWIAKRVTHNTDITYRLADWRGLSRGATVWKLWRWQPGAQKWLPIAALSKASCRVDSATMTVKDGIAWAESQILS